MTLLPRRRTRDGRGRTLRLVSVAALPLAAPVVVAPVAEATASAPTYVVQSGDTLSGIALRFDTDVATLVRLNRLEDPDVVLAGTTLVLPTPVVRAPAPSPRAVLYTVKAGDTIWDIAARTGTTVGALLAANQLDADARIRPGQVLALPTGRTPAERPVDAEAEAGRAARRPRGPARRDGQRDRAAVPHQRRGDRQGQQARQGRGDHAWAEARAARRRGHGGRRRRVPPSPTRTSCSAATPCPASR